LLLLLLLVLLRPLLLHRLLRPLLHRLLLLPCVARRHHRGHAPRLGRLQLGEA
jgi:hypothetical protein